MNKKLVLLILIFVILFILFVFFLNKESSYEYIYEVNKYNIYEEYNKENKIYIFEIDDFIIELSDDYTNERGLISEVKEYENDEGYSCIEIKGSLNFYNICQDNDEFYFDNLIKEEKKIETYSNINIYNKLNKKYLIWNYNEFIYFGDDNKKIDILEKDVYNPTLIYQLEDKLFIPNYDEEYKFSKYYLVEFEDGKVSEEELNTDISLDIVYTGYTKDILSIYDDKNNKEYDLEIGSDNVKTKNKVSYSASDLKSINYKDNKFILNNNKLIYNNYETDIFVSDLEVNKIVYQNNTEVIFLSDSKLYYFDIYQNNITLLMENSEWNYNYDNLIYIY